MNLTIIASLALLLLNSASAFALSEDDNNAAIKAAENSELGGTIECGREMGNPIDLDIKPMDLNGDGVEEIMITASHKNGGTACFNVVGMSNTLMIKAPSGE